MTNQNSEGTPSLPAPPLSSLYTRHVLLSRPRFSLHAAADTLVGAELPLDLPVAIPPSEWNAFWTQSLQPILKGWERLENFQGILLKNYLRFGLFGSIMMHAICPMVAAVVFAIMVCPIYAFLDWFKRRRWKALHRVWDAQAEQWQTRHKVTLDLNYECWWNDPNAPMFGKEGFCLYWVPIPTSNSFRGKQFKELKDEASTEDGDAFYDLRFAVSTRHFGNSWTLFHALSSLQIPPFQFLPSECQGVLDEKVWCHLRCKWFATSKDYHASHCWVAVHQWVALAIWLVVCVVFEIEALPLWMYIGAPMCLILALCGLLRAKVRKQDLYLRRIVVVQAFNRALLPQKGLYLEHRMVAELGRFYGLCYVEYLHLFRLTVAQSN